jgi:hypothetical protein
VRWAVSKDGRSEENPREWLDTARLLWRSLLAEKNYAGVCREVYLSLILRFGEASPRLAR